MFYSFLALSLSAKYNITHSFWSKDGKDAISYKNYPTYTTFSHTGTNIYAVNCKDKIILKTGTVYKLSCRLSVQGDGLLNFGFESYNQENKVTSWSLAEHLVKERSQSGEWFDFSYKFLVLENPSYTRLRFYGSKAINVSYELASIEVVSTFEKDEQINNSVIENDKLRVHIDSNNLTINVYDKTSKRNYTQIKKYPEFFPLRAEQTNNSVTVTAMHKKECNICTFYFELDGNEMQINISLDNNAEFEIIKYPYSFITQSGDSLIFPHGEGMIIPVDEEEPFYLTLSTFSGHGACMAFSGIAHYEETSEGATTGREGYMILLQTNDDSQLKMLRPRRNVGEIEVQWLPQKGKWGYTRKCRLIFFADGGHVTMAKRYLNYSKEIGLHKTFFQKIKENPMLEKPLMNMRGAANIWLYSHQREIYSEMQDKLDMKYILSSYTYDSDFIEWCNNRSILSSRYDVYQDALDPKYKNRVSWHPDWVDEAFARNELVVRDDGKLQEGWGVILKDTGEMVYCNVVNDKFWKDYMIKKVDKELENGDNRTCRFIDVATAAKWYQDYSPDHPTTRTISKMNRQKALGTVGSRYGMVCGSETGHDAVVPYCDYFEGMMSLPSFRTKDSGRAPNKIVWDPEESVVKYQLGHRYRLPLWELVYHDCLVAYWYWGDSNNKMPTLWDKRDLFNALYGVPPMYNFHIGIWNENKTLFQRSYKRASPVARLTMFYEMLNHSVLTKDWLVQQTLYANGVRSTVNFGSSPYNMSDGYILEGNSFRLEENVTINGDDKDKDTDKDKDNNDNNDNNNKSEEGKTKSVVSLVLCVAIPLVVIVCLVTVCIICRRKKQTTDESTINEVIVV